MPVISSSWLPSISIPPSSSNFTNNECTTFFLHPQKLLTPTFSSLCIHTKINCLKSSIMERNTQLKAITLESTQEKYSQELDVAVKAVQMACSLCQNVQEGLRSKSSLVQSKDDDSLVTIADCSRGRC